MYESNAAQQIRTQITKTRMSRMPQGLKRAKVRALSAMYKAELAASRRRMPALRATVRHWSEVAIVGAMLNWLATKAGAETARKWQHITASWEANHNTRADARRMDRAYNATLARLAHVGR